MTIDHSRRRILVIDDNDAVHDDYRKTLAGRSPINTLAAAASMIFDSPAEAPAPVAHFDLDFALTGEEGCRMVRHALDEARPYAVAFVDMRKPPGWDGVETVEHLWQVDPELQVVICTAHSDYSWEEVSTRLGHSDRLLILRKPFDPMEVCQLATALSEKWKLKRQAVVKQQELQHMVSERTADLRRAALVDRLTGLPNRAGLLEFMGRVTAAGPHGAPPEHFALFFLDFDRFKLVNDSFGHQAGDQLLMEISRRMRELLQLGEVDSDGMPERFAARLGGDEFVVVQRGVSSVEQAEMLAQRLLAGLDAPYTVHNQTVHSSASIGITLSDPSRSLTQDMLREADTAMYRAKSLGRARYAVFTPEMQDNAVARLTLENDLRRGFEKHEFFMRYQPIIRLTDNSLEGFEALLRWRHPQRGLIDPKDFIPVAEDTGLIIAIGKWVLDESLRQLAHWRQSLPAAEDISISVNCSKQQLSEPDFAGFVRQALHRHGIPAQRLNLEITENAIIDRLEQTLEVINDLKAAGVHLHMDDFGTGYSSLAYLHLLQLHVLKIDRSFIVNVSLRRDYASVVNSIIQLAQNLGMRVVAEGVETADHAAMLCALECDMGQGYFFARPLGPDEAAAMIAISQEPPVLQTA